MRGASFSATASPLSRASPWGPSARDAQALSLVEQDIHAVFRTVLLPGWITALRGMIAAITAAGTPGQGCNRVPFAAFFASALLEVVLHGGQTPPHPLTPEGESDPPKPEFFLWCFAPGRYFWGGMFWSIIHTSCVKARVLDFFLRPAFFFW